MGGICIYIYICGYKRLPYRVLGSYSPDFRILGLYWVPYFGKLPSAECTGCTILSHVLWIGGKRPVIGNAYSKLIALQV